MVRFPSNSNSIDATGFKYRYRFIVHCITNIQYFKVHLTTRIENNRISLHVTGANPPPTTPPPTSSLHSLALYHRLGNPGSASDNIIMNITLGNY